MIYRDAQDIRFRLAGYPAIFSNPVPAKTVPGTGYLIRIVLGPFSQLVELSSPIEWVPWASNASRNTGGGGKADYDHHVRYI